jgi:hypothetical protein
VPNPGQEGRDDDGVGDVCDTDSTLGSRLGHDRRPSLLDQDTFTFTGTARERVTITLEKDPVGMYAGDRATLMLTDKIARVSLLRIDSSLDTERAGIRRTCVSSRRPARWESNGPGSCRPQALGGLQGVTSNRRDLLPDNLSCPY